MEEESAITTVAVQVSPEADASVQALADEVSHLAVYAEARTITSTADVKAATEDLSIIAGLKKALEAKRKEYVGPLDALKKSIDATFKRITERLEQANQVTRSKVLAYQAEQTRKAQEAQRIADAEAQLARDKAALNGSPVPVTPKLVIPEVPTTSHGELGTSNQRANWKWEVIDFALVPDEYKMVNPAVLTPVVKASKGKVPIPGIRQYNDPIIAVTSFVNKENNNADDRD